MTVYEDVWHYLGKEGAPTSDFVMVVNASLSDIRAYTGRQLTLARVRDVFEYTPRKLVLAEYPVVSVESLKVDGSDITTGFGFKLDKTRGEIRAYNYTSCIYCTFPVGGEIEIEYTAGYQTLPATIIRTLAESYTASSASGGGAATGPIKSVQIEGVGTIGYGLDSSKSRYGSVSSQNLNMLASFKAATQMLAFSERHSEILEDLDPVSPAYDPDAAVIHDFTVLLEQYQQELDAYQEALVDATTLDEVDGGNAASSYPLP